VEIVARERASRRGEVAHSIIPKGRNKVDLSIVIVDDSDINLTLFKYMVARIPGVTPQCFAVSAEALDWCEQHGADVVVVDYMMPAPDGLEFIRRFRAFPGLTDVPVVMVTANDLKEVRYAALEAGATDFLTKPVDKNEFIARIGNMATLRRGQRLLADRAALLTEEVAAATLTIVERERETIFRLSRAAEYRDPETGSHIMRMANYSRLIATALGTAVEDQQLIFEAAPMHDIGKVGIPDMILLKPGRLTPEEFEVMKRHATIGHEILQGSTSPKLNAAAVMFAHNHPSGITEPSQADRCVTDKLKQVLGLFDIRTLDHFIVGKGGTYSFAEHGLI